MKYKPPKIKETIQTMRSIVEEHDVLSLDFFFETGSLFLYPPDDDDGEEIEFCGENPIPVLDAYGYIRTIAPQKEKVRGRLVALDPVFEEDL